MNNKYIKFILENKKIIISIVIITVLLIVMFVIFNSYSFIGEIKKGNYDKAIEVFNSKVKGDFKKTEETKKETENLIESTIEKFNKNEIGYEEANNILSTVEKTNMLSKKVEEFIETLELLNNSKISYNKALEYVKSQDYYHAIISFYEVEEKDSNYKDAQKQLETLVTQYKDIILSQIEQDKNANYEDKISELEKLKNILNDDTEVQAKIEIYKDKQIESLEQNQEVSVISAKTHKEWYSDSISGIQVIVKNNTNKVVKDYTVGMLAYDKNGYPLKINYNSNIEEGNSKSANIQPKQTHGEDEYYSIIYEQDKMSKVISCVKEVTYYDGSKWENPYYQYWLEEHEDKPLK